MNYADTPISLKDIQAAHERIAGYVRRTPIVHAAPLKHPPERHGDLYLKLECMQISGSFKARGAANKLLSTPQAQVARGLVTASGGNHALGVAYAGWLAKTSVTIYLPHNTPSIKAQKLENWGAKVIFEGEVWDEANQAALATAERDNLVYIHPFADPDVIAGQGTIALEILQDLPEVDLLLVAIGGGGLIGGVSLAAKALKPTLKVIGVEPVGAPTLYESLQAGHVIELDEIHTQANTLAPRKSTALNYGIIQQNVDEIVLVSDEEMRSAAQWLWFEMGIAAELSGAAALAALLSGKVQPVPPFDSAKICVLVCGAGSDGIN